MHRLLFVLVAVLWLAPAPARAVESDAKAEPSPPAAAADAPAEPEAPTVQDLPPLMLEARVQRAQLEQLVVRVRELAAQLVVAEGEDALVLDHQIAETKLDFLKGIRVLVDNLEAQDEEGLEGAEVRAWIEATLPELSESLELHLDMSEAKLSELRKRRVATDASGLDEIEDEVQTENDWLDALLTAYLDNIDSLERMGLDSSGAKQDLRERLSLGADRLAGRIQLTIARLENLERRQVENPDDAEIKEGLRLATRRKETAISALTQVVDKMDRVDLDSTDYRRLLIMAKGEVTADVFRTRVALGLLEDGVESLREWLRVAGPAFVVKAFLFLLILLGFRLIAVVAVRVVRRAISAPNVGSSQLVNNMVLGLATRGIMLLGLLVALSQLGVELGPLLAGLGIAGFIVGFALQDSLANFAAGIMILGYRPFDIGDVIEAGGVFGTVSTMSLVSTTILTFDNQTLIVPNAKIWGDVIKNVTNQRDRRVDLEVHVAHSEDVDKAREVLLEILRAHPKVLADPEPNVRLHKLLKSSLQFIVRPWVATTDYWDVYWDVTAEIKRRFDKEGIEIPHPKRDVRLVRDGDLREAGPGT